MLRGTRAGVEGKLGFKTTGCLSAIEQQVSDLTLVESITTNRLIGRAPFYFGGLIPSSFGRKYGSIERFKLEMEKRR